MNNTKNIIRELRRAYNLTQDEFGRIAKVGPATVSSWERGISFPRIEALERIAEHFGLEVTDLVGSTKANRIPVLGRVPAGIPIEAIEDILDYEDIPKEWLTGDREYFGLKVTGDSMSPKYLDGDVVICRKQYDCESGQDCVVCVNGCDATLKKVIKQGEQTILQPINPNYPPCIYTSDVHIVGVVVELRRKI